MASRNKRLPSRPLPRPLFQMIYIALLRAVNVGGRKLAMADLTAMISSLPFKDVRTVLQTGNLIFAAPQQSGDALALRLEKETLKRFQLDTRYFVRTLDEWDAILRANPFRKEAAEDPSYLLVLPLASNASDDAWRGLKGAIPGREKIQAGKRCLYAYYPDGIGESKLTVAFIERKLGTACTGRNWNTALKIQAAARITAEGRSSSLPRH